jgi:hypothetical protein
MRCRRRSATGEQVLHLARLADVAAERSHALPEKALVVEKT